MKKIVGWAVATVFTCSFTTLVSGQNLTPPKWEVGLSGGAFIYQGDLAPSLMGSYKLARPGGSVFGSYLLNPFLSFRTSLTVASLQGDDRKYGHDAWRQARALRFKTSVFEVSESVVWDVFGNNFDRSRTRFSPYLFAGVGYSFLNVRRDASRFDTAYFGAQSVIANGLKADLARKPPRGVVVVPVGVGVRYAVAPAWSVLLETAYRFSETDYLDGFSRVGNNGRNDHYYSFSLGVVFTFLRSKAMACPVMKE